jgi:hypothetical protein
MEANQKFDGRCLGVLRLPAFQNIATRNRNRLWYYVEESS